MPLYPLLRPLLFRLPAETAHELALACGALVQPLLPPAAIPPSLSTRCLGLHFPGPVGLAAGMDKDARLLSLWAALGFGFVEIGSVTAQPTSGNPRPRAFRLPQDHAIINRLGLPSQGADAVAARLSTHKKASRSAPPMPLGVNLAATPGSDGVADFCQSFRLLAPLADYVTLNLSCPNTEDGRLFSDPATLSPLLTAIFRLRQQVAPAVPVLLKLPPAPPPPEPPSLPHLRQILRLCGEHGVAGLIAGNTAPDRAGLRTPAPTLSAIGRGGLSGRPLLHRTRAQILALSALMRQEGPRLPLIALGGADSAASVASLLSAGASLVQLYTGLVYEGPGLVRRIHRDLAALLRDRGLRDLSELEATAEDVV